MGGKEFTDVSAVSGLDHPGDGRAFSWLDFDRDGWLDAAVVGANAPRFALYRNLGGQQNSTQNPTMEMIALRFEGGNKTPNANPAWSNRDGYGTAVEVELNGKILLREHRAGEGMGAQNSATMLIGLGEQSQVNNIRVRWPSGKTQSIGPINAGQLVTIFENKEAAPAGQSFTVAPYAATTDFSTIETPHNNLPVFPPLVSPSGEQRLIMYTTMATWCGPCIAELPVLTSLRDSIGENVMAMVGLPYDEDEGENLLEDWLDNYNPPYQLLTTLANDSRTAAKNILKGALKIDGLPATLITDTRGRVLLTRFGPPNESEIRALLAATDTVPTPVVRDKPTVVRNKPILLPLINNTGESKLIMYTTMATWCGPCLAELPALTTLRDSIGENIMAMVGLPYDEEEGEDLLTEWVSKYTPPYQLLIDLSEQSRAAAKKILTDALQIDGLPATLITDSEGHVLLTRFGPPNESEIRALLDKLEQ